MNNMRHFFIPVILITLFSCSEVKQDSISRVWFFNAEFTDQHLSEDSALGRTADYSLSPANFINLREDGSYSAYMTQFEEGKWTVKEENLILINRDKKIREYQIHRRKNDEMVLLDKMKRLIYRFNGYPNNFATLNEDPFAAQYNQWRYKAKHKESDKELAGRLKNHFQFWEKYFDWGVNKKVDYLDVRSTPTPVKLYGNGFQLYYQEELSHKWQEIFYDTADSRIAYEMLYYKMYEKDIQWPKTENKFTGFASAFKQLQGWMDEPVSKYVNRVEQRNMNP
jgi:hypothetical protein